MYAAMFEISEATVRRYESDVLAADLPELDFDDLEILLIDEKSVRKGHGYRIAGAGPLRGAGIQLPAIRKSRLAKITTPRRPRSVCPRPRAGFR
jgi:hypothetical protein